MSQSNDTFNPQVKKIRIQSKVDESANWNIDSSETLLDREVGYDITNGGYKIGNGISHWTDLPWAGPTKTDMTNLTDTVKNNKSELNEMINNVRLDLNDKNTNLTNSIENTKIELTKDIDTTKKDLTKNIADSHASLSQQCAAINSKLTASISEVNNTISTLDDKVNTNHSTMEERITETQNEINSEIVKTKELIDTDIAGVNSRLDATIADTATNFNQVTQEIETAKSKASDDLQATEDKIDGQINEVVQEFTTQIANVNSKINEEIEKIDFSPYAKSSDVEATYVKKSGDTMTGALKTTVIKINDTHGISRGTYGALLLSANSTSDNTNARHLLIKDKTASDHADNDLKNALVLMEGDTVFPRDGYKIYGEHNCNKYYYSLTEIDNTLTITSSINSIIQKMQDKSMLIADITVPNNTTAPYPCAYGILYIHKIRENRVNIEYISNTAENTMDYNKRWTGQYNAGTFGGFKLVQTNHYAQDIITTPTKDTVETWEQLGSGTFWFTKSGQLIDQPHTYGFVINTAFNKEISQFFCVQGKQGGIYYRSGNYSGWHDRVTNAEGVETNKGGNWTRLLDETNYQFETKTYWLNADSDATQGITGIQPKNSTSYPGYKIYDFRNDYTSNTYDLKIKLDIDTLFAKFPDSVMDYKEAFADLELYAPATQNILVALGDIDSTKQIPLLVTAIKKPK